MSRVLPVTAPLREAREHLRRTLEGVAARVGTLAAQPLEMRSAAMHQVVDELDERLLPHLDWEERTIHPVVDKFACEGPAAFSASMRYEHRIIRRGIDDLRERAADAGAVVAFSRRADNLLGVILAHFELEEEVLFPILDRALRGTSLTPIIAPPPGGSPVP
jgi:iron-sulfur cluster repair protein YtfE (RIC family)